MIPKIDQDIGMSVYSTSFLGIGGSIRNKPEDFLVSEVLSEQSLSKINQNEGYAVYKLKKQGIDTNHFKITNLLSVSSNCDFKSISDHVFFG